MYKDYEHAKSLWRHAIEAHENQQMVFMYAAVSYVQEWIRQNFGADSDSRASQYGGVANVLANPLAYAITDRDLVFLLRAFNLGDDEHDQLIERLMALEVKLPEGLRLVIRSDVRQWYDQGSKPQKCLAVTHIPANIESFLDV